MNSHVGADEIRPIIFGQASPAPTIRNVGACDCHPSEGSAPAEPKNEIRKVAYCPTENSAYRMVLLLLDRKNPARHSCAFRKISEGRAPARPR